MTDVPPMGPMPDGVTQRWPACQIPEGKPGAGADWNVCCPKCQIAWMVARDSMTPEEVATGDGLMAEAHRQGMVDAPCARPVSEGYRFRLLIQDMIDPV